MAAGEDEMLQSLQLWTKLRQANECGSLHGRRGLGMGRLKDSAALSTHWLGLALGVAELNGKWIPCSKGDVKLLASAPATCPAASEGNNLFSICDDVIV